MARWSGRAYGLVLALVGLILLIGGRWLIALGGSPYYLLAGVAVAVAGLLSWRGDRRAGLVYAAFLTVTALWATWESGTEGWALFARLFAPAALGLPFLFLARRHGRGARLAALAAPLLLAAVLLRVVLPDAPAGRALAALAPAGGGEGEWRAWGGDPGGTRYSPLAEITPGNVGHLAVAWTYRTGIPADGKLGNLEVTPLMVGKRLYLCNNMNMVDALDPETGRRLWRFDPHADVSAASARVCRGVAYVEVGGAVCPRRILTNTLDAKLWAIDADTGRACPDFGTGGMVDLARGMGPVGNGYYYPTSAPTVVRGRVIVGGWVIDGQKTGSPPGVVRAFDVRTGAFAWAWDMGRLGDHKEPAPGHTYTLGTPNAWGPMSADEALGLVYFPTGNAGPDIYGAGRTAESDRYSSSVVALDATTGVARWAFQAVHHDLWDYDLGSQPTLIDWRDARGVVPALVQATKSGQLFVLDRRTGRPLTRVEERPTPQAGAPGERLSLTQPFSVEMPSLVGPALTEARMWGLTPLDQLWCRIQFRQVRYDGEMTPPGLRPTLESPGYMGAVSWGGVSVDPRRRVLIVNSMRVPTWHQLLPRAEADRLGLAPRGTPGAIARRGYAAQAGTPFAAYSKAFLSPLGVPCTQPPYGVVTAVDLSTGRTIWDRPLGTGRDSGPLGVESGLPLPMGVPNLGGSIITASGLVFIGATQERSFRALSLADGRTLWSARLPAGGQATPMTFRAPGSGRQFVVIAAGGKGLLQSKVGDYLVAYALPRGR